MRALRFTLLLLLAPPCLLVHDFVDGLYERYAIPVSHNMLGFAIHIHFTGWALIILLPLCILFGNMWWNDRCRYLPHVPPLKALVFGSMNVWTSDPSRTPLFQMRCWATLTLRWVTERMANPR